jgi:hypothetical protein
MSRNWFIGIGAALLSLAALVGVGVTAYELGQDDTEHIVVSGTETAGRVIVEHDGWRHGGPGFLIIPLLIIGAIFLLASRRRHGWCGPGYRGPGPWYDGRHDDLYDGRHESRYDWERVRQPERPSDAPPPAPPAAAP